MLFRSTFSILPSSVTEPLRRMDNPSSRRNRMQADLGRQSQATAAQLPVLRSFSKGGSTRELSRAVGGPNLSVLQVGVNQTGWNRLPWVRLLQLDPFYARLVNTYLLANALWVLVIQTSFSNRFAYLSWFMMPWVLLYPFVPGKIIDRPRTGLIAAILCAHYLFTYVMVEVVVPLRGGGIL